MFRTIELGIFNKAVAKLGLSDADRISAHGYRPFDPDPPEPIPALGAYKANPAEGMWASPPFLRNGSVPSLYELLLPAGERSKQFFVGREFDPVKVGVDTSGNSGRFLYDTALVGNSNAGHSFEGGPRRKGVIGPRLTEEERWALVEYRKSIPSQPRQISPFGGPKDPEAIEPGEKDLIDAITRDVMMKEVGAEDVYFEFGVQLQTDLVKMPVEDPLVIWDEVRSPFKRVAIIRIPRQNIGAKSWVEFAESLSFTPWHSLPEHRPLGSSNRARRVIYEAISEFRHKMNAAPRQEPRDIRDIPRAASQ